MSPSVVRFRCREVLFLVAALAATALAPARAQLSPEGGQQTQDDISSQTGEVREVPRPRQRRDAPPRAERSREAPPAATAPTPAAPVARPERRREAPPRRDPPRAEASRAEAPREREPPAVPRVRRDDRDTRDTRDRRDNRNDRDYRDRDYRTGGYPSRPPVVLQRPARPPVIVPVLPPGHRSYVWRGSPYYFHGGAWYRPYGSRFVVTVAPFGLFVPFLPGYYSTLWVGGTRYYYADSTYYLYDPLRRGYVVTRSPYDDEPDEGGGGEEPDGRDQDLYVYPARGQGEQQQADDRYACHRWAVGQTEYDPTQSEYNPDARADYDRAITACLEGRGYSVR